MKAQIISAKFKDYCVTECFECCDSSKTVQQVEGYTSQLMSNVLLGRVNYFFLRKMPHVPNSPSGAFSLRRLLRQFFKYCINGAKARPKLNPA